MASGFVEKLTVLEVEAVEAVDEVVVLNKRSSSSEEGINSVLSI